MKVYSILPLRRDRLIAINDIENGQNIIGRFSRVEWGVFIEMGEGERNEKIGVKEGG